MDIEQLEALALADDRDAAVSALVVGSEDHDWWRAVRLQHQGDLDAVDGLLARWVARHGDGPRRRALHRRQLLLRADRDLPGTAAALAEELDVSFDYAPEIEHEVSPHPTALDPALLDPARLVADAVARDRGLGLVRDDGLALVLADEPDADLRRQLLGRLARGGLPGLVYAIAAELSEPGSRGFGALAAHRALVLQELDELGAKVPALRTDRAFVLARLTRLRPPPHVDLDLPDARAEHLDRLWSEVAGLAPSFNELKAHVLGHRLAVDLERGVVDRSRLMTWLALPRRAPYASPKWLAGIDHRHVASLGEDFSEATGLGPLPPDEALVRPMLAELLVTEGPEAFAPWVDARWLDVLLAETRLLAGDADVERWTTRLGPAATAALRDRVDIEILPTNARCFGRDEPVFLDVALKNAWPLRMRVFRINTAAWTASGRGPVPLDIDLDGLAAGFEEVVEAAPVPPLRRVRTRLALTACDRPGTWVVELVGQGRASRMLLHKGHLSCATRPTAAGLEAVVLDELGRHRPEARVHLGPRELVPDADGVVHLPFGTRGDVQAVLVDGDLVVPATVRLPSEQVTFRTSVLLDRQSIVAGTEARALLRGDLRIGGARAALDLLEDPWVEVTTTDRTGVAATRRQPIRWSDDAECELTVAIPDHLQSLSLAVGGRVHLVSEQRRQELRHAVQISVGGIHASDATEALVATRSVDGWTLSLLGKSGEARAGRAVRVSLEHRFSSVPVDCVLATDPQGAIALGALPGVVRVTGRTPSGVVASWSLLEPTPEVPRSRVVRAGEELLLAVPLGATDVSVVELRGGQPARDHSGLARIEPGSLRLAALPAGLHRIRASPGVDLTVRVLPADVALAAGYATVAGEILPVPPAPTALGAVDASADGLEIRVVGATSATRVHVLATPFWPAPTDGAPLSSPAPVLPSSRVGRPRSQWVSGRDIGDEARYVLDRRGLPRRAGTLLERPSLLVQPWALRTTTTAVQGAKIGEAWAAGAAAPAPALRAEDGRARRSALREVAADPAFDAWDFLAVTPSPIPGLRPDDDGVVRVAASDLGPGPVVSVVCVDPSGTTWRTVSLAPAALAVRDLRLPESDPGHLREERVLAAAGPGTRRSVARMRVAVVDTLEPLYRALCAVGGDPDLASWDFLPRWGSMTRQERLDTWDRFGCHELAVFVKLKDPELFELLRPTLVCRLQPTFLDDWLMDRDLGAWIEPHRLARLNAFERALLARALPEARSALVRTLAEDVDLQVEDRAADDRFVDTLLAGGEAPDEAPPEPEPEPAPGGAPSDAFGAMADEVLEEEPSKKAKGRRGAASRGGGGSRDRTLREEAEPLYRGADQTREWAEHRWWHTPLADQGPDVITVARLWRDFAAHAHGPFLPEHLAEAASSFAASVCALAVIELPFVAPARSRVVAGELQVESVALVALAALSAVVGEPTGEVLVGQTTVRADDRWEWEGAERREKLVSGELATGVVYTTEVAVTNPSARSRRLAVLVQIPDGAIAVGGGVPTRTSRVSLGAYATTTVSVSWYFPLPGTYRQSGGTVTDGERTLAVAPERTFVVQRVPATTDTTSWGHLSQRGTLDQVLEFLATRPLGREDLGRIAWRMRDRGAFERVIAQLASRHVFEDVLWSHGLLHHHRDAVRVWLAHQEALLAEVGPLKTDLVTFDPVDRGLEEHLEYAPLVNARAHRLGGRRTVLNDGLAARWQAFLTRVALQPSPSPEDRLVATQALYTLDRPEEAAAQLDRVPRDAVPSVLQHDWLSAHRAIAQADLATARALATPWIEHPVPRWRKRFAAVVAMLDEVDGRAPATAQADDGRDARMAELAARQPSLRVRLDGARLVLESSNLTEAEVRAYGMDIELLFSRQPFLDSAGDRFTWIDPGAVTRVALEPSGRTVWPLGDDIRHQNAVLEVVAGPLRQVVTHFANDLTVTPSEAYGQLQVRRASTGRPLAAAYVKVFARGASGVQFFKDGYTDLRGRLDYATLSTDDLDRVERFALLVVHDDAGATILEVAPPTR